MRTYKRISAALLCLLLLLAAVPASSADAPPSLFYNEEPWYKDALAPLVERDGVVYIPAEFCAMLDGIELTTPREGNLLLSNRNTGAYVSILFPECSAVLCGKIVDDIGVFRDGSMYYVEAQTVCGALGIEWESGEWDNGAAIGQIGDENRRQTLDELLSGYRSMSSIDLYENTDPVPETPSGPQKRIYVLCGAPYDGVTDEDGREYNVFRTLRDAGMACTVFLREDAADGDVLAAVSCGAYGLMPPDGADGDLAETLLARDGQIRNLTRRHARLTLSTGDASADADLRKAGFAPLAPDFTVDAASDLWNTADAIIAHLRYRSSCLVFLEDCWNGEAMVGALGEMLRQNPGWAVLNLSAN